MKTGIKTSSPATISPGGTLNNILFYAINQPRVEIVLKISDKSNTFSIYGYKDYGNDFILQAIDSLNNILSKGKSLFIHLEITNKIPFGIGLGAHASFMACLLKLMSAANNINYNNRELYNLLLTNRNTFIKRISPGRLLTSLEGGCMFIDNYSPQTNQRVYLPIGLSFIVFHLPNQTETKKTILISEKELNKSIELILGLQTSNWELIKQGFTNTLEFLSFFNFTIEEINILSENILGFDYNKVKGLFIFYCNNSIKTDICVQILRNRYQQKKSNSIILTQSLADLTGTIKL